MPDLYITPEIEAVLAIPDLVKIIHFSGGKDSECVLHALHKRSPTDDIRLALADTGNEYEDDTDGRWISAANWCIQRSAHYGYPLTIVCNSKRTLQQEVVERNRFPSSKERWCTSHHKRGPLEKYIRSLDADHILSIKGIRADESDQRAGKAPWEQHLKLTVSKTRKTKRPRIVWNWLPIFYWTLDDVLTYVEDNEIPLHPAYAFQDRFSCEWCIFYGPKQIAAMYDNNRQAFNECHDLELKTNFTLSPSRKFLRQIVEEYKASGKKWIPPTAIYTRRHNCDY